MYDDPKPAPLSRSKSTSTGVSHVNRISKSCSPVSRGSPSNMLGLQYRSPSVTPGAATVASYSSSSSCSTDPNAYFSNFNMTGSPSNASVSSFPSLDDATVIEPAESSGRRLLELQLLHNYLTNISNRHLFTTNPFLELWNRELPALIPHHSNLLYAVLSISAGHLLASDPGNHQFRDAHENYITLALREQHNALASMGSNNTSSVCFTSVLLLSDFFATLQYRPIEPYEPPMEWLNMGRGTAIVFRAAQQHVQTGGGGFDANLIAPILNSVLPKMGNPMEASNVFRAQGHEMPSEVPWLLSQPDSLDDMGDRETFNAYMSALAYIGRIKRALELGEDDGSISVQLLAFAGLVPGKFVDFVGEMRPRALVILAHYFALAGKFNGDGSMQKAAERELRGIGAAVPVEWQLQMPWGKWFGGGC